MAVEYEISSDVAVIKETGSVSQCARVTQMYSGQITYDDEAGSKFATATINGKSQRVMLCIAVNGTVTYDDVPSLYSTVDGHRCLNIVTPTETGTPDDVPSLYETVVIDGQNVRAVRCIMINKTPVYDGVSSTCTFTGDDGKTHTAQLVNKVTGGSVEVIIKGTSPLNLPDAIANSLSYVKAFGGTEQNGTPTPDAPMDIISNNGVLKARHQSGLPLGYTLLDYITFGGTQYIDTGLTINNNTRVLFDIKRSSSSAQSSYPWLGGVRDYVPNTNINKKTLEFSSKDSTKLYLQYATSGEITLTVPYTTQRHTYDFNKNELYIDENLIHTATQETFTSNATFLIGTMYSQGSVSTASMFYGNVYGFKLWQDGTNLSMNLIPAKRNSDNVVGMYDLVSGQFFTNQGTGTFTAGTPVSDPVEIYTDGTVETINVHGKNLIDVANFQIPNNSASSILWTGSMTGPLRLSVDKSQVTSVGAPGIRFLILVVNGNTTYVSYNDTDSVAINGTLTSIRCYNSGAYAKVKGKISLQLERGTTATEYQPYYDGGTATTEILLSVGIYTDQQEVISGSVAKKCGAVILDSSFEWTYDNTYGRVNTTIPNLWGSTVARTVPGFCTHFEWLSHQESVSSITAGQCYSAGANRIFLHISQTSAAAFAAWLDAQRDAGTPVIIVFPLETATTESVAGQPLQVTDGDNIVEITQASLSGLELEVEYQAAVSLTIQEVQDANLDNNVTVTIQ